MRRARLYMPNLRKHSTRSPHTRPHPRTVFRFASVHRYIHTYEVSVVFSPAGEVSGSSRARPPYVDRIDTYIVESYLYTLLCAGSAQKKNQKKNRGARPSRIRVLPADRVLFRDAGNTCVCICVVAVVARELPHVWRCRIWMGRKSANHVRALDALTIDVGTAGEGTQDRGSLRMARNIPRLRRHSPPEV